MPMNKINRNIMEELFLNKWSVNAVSSENDLVTKVSMIPTALKGSFQSL